MYSVEELHNEYSAAKELAKQGRLDEYLALMYAENYITELERIVKGVFSYDRTRKEG